MHDFDRRGDDLCILTGGPQKMEQQVSVGSDLSHIYIIFEFEEFSI